MKKKCSFWLLIFTLGIVLITTMFINRPTSKDSLMSFWIGEYCYEEYLPPNMGMTYLITIYEDDGLYARIKIDGFQTIKRLKAKVWSNGEEVMFEFYDYYTDEGGNSTIPEKYNVGDILLKLKKQDNVLITEWRKIQPMITENEEPGQYFTKSIE